ncbi:hypothetical protein OTU49_011011 [Cherax quadricarinatus]|uniref:Uncharacterized protein n=1 Tax=Cherax quadricarinatus TaxID=27406 RepID=A0AAW0WD99_CHEQU
MARYIILLVVFLYVVLLFVNECTRIRKWELINAVRARYRHELSQGLNIDVTSFVVAQTDSTEAVWDRVPVANTVITLVRNYVWTEWLMAETKEVLSCFSPWIVRGYLLTGVLSLVLVVAFTFPYVVIFITWIDKSLKTCKKLTSGNEDEENKTPSADIDNVYEDPSADTDDVYEDPSADTDDVYEDPSADTDDVYEDPSADTDDVYEDPSADIDDVYEDPSPDTDDVYEDPSADIDDVYEDPSADTDDVYEDPSADIDDVYEDPLADMGNFKEVPSDIFVVVFQEAIDSLKLLLNSFEEDLEELVSLSDKHLSGGFFSETSDYIGSYLEFVKDTNLFIDKCTQFVRNLPGLPSKDNGRVKDVQYARGGIAYLLIFDV